jgi:hypothetical protein
MHPLIQLKKATPVILLVLAWFALSPIAQAVSPAPDGGYPGFNTAEGTNALSSLTSGVANTAVGWLSLFSNTDGSFNTAVGAGTLLFNVGDQSAGEGVKNTAIGTAALLFNIDGDNNAAVGAAALINNTTGDNNTAAGADTLSSNTEGCCNVAVGRKALTANTSSLANTAVGYQALAGSTSSSSSFNTALGYNAGQDVDTANNVICIGANVFGADVSNTCFIGNIRGTTTINNNAVNVVIDSAGQLGTISSSRRFKKEIKPMDKASEAILALKPVTFHYKNDNTGRPEFGLIAEEVLAVNPDLVVRDDKGEIYTVRYDAVNAMLLNEFLKEHRTVQEQGAIIARQQKQIEALTAGLQKVNDKIELSKPAAQTVLNNH